MVQNCLLLQFTLFMQIKMSKTFNKTEHSNSSNEIDWNLNLFIKINFLTDYKITFYPVD